MPSYKSDNGKWYCSFYYTDGNGKKLKKKKSGFNLKREADAWEREFLTQQITTVEMPFEKMVKLYLEDCEMRLKPSTMYSKRGMFTHQITPYFEGKSVDSITPLDIRSWQNTILSKNISAYYKKTLNGQLNALFNFAVRFYNLPKSPCKDIKLIGKTTRRMSFWTYDDYKKFINACEAPHLKMAVELMYWTGMRNGEMLALTPSDIDFEGNKISITKTYYNGRVLTPKTESSVRQIGITESLSNKLKEYVEKTQTANTERIFPHNKGFINLGIPPVAKRCGIPSISSHSLRHSHAAYLINKLGAAPLYIKERFGHKSIKVTMDTYGHMYPSSEDNLINQMENDAF